MHNFTIKFIYSYTHINIFKLNNYYIYLNETATIKKNYKETLNIPFPLNDFVALKKARLLKTHNLTFIENNEAEISITKSIK